MKTGQVIPSNNHLGEYAKDRPVHVQELFATLYHQLGIDVEERTIVGPSGRPMYLLARQDALPELIGLGLRRKQERR
jgi:hypothetical protein